MKHLEAYKLKGPEEGERGGKVLKLRISILVDCTPASVGGFRHLFPIWLLTVTSRSGGESLRSVVGSEQRGRRCFCAHYYPFFALPPGLKQLHFCWKLRNISCTVALRLFTRKQYSYWAISQESRLIVYFQPTLLKVQTKKMRYSKTFIVAMKTQKVWRATKYNKV